MRRSLLLACLLLVLPLSAAAQDAEDKFPGYGAAATAQLTTKKGCGYEEWTVTATKIAGQREGPFERSDEYVAKEVPCDELPAKTTAPKDLVAALRKAKTPMPKDARVVLMGKIVPSVKEGDKRVSYRQATLRIYSKELELSLGRCGDLNKNVLCGAMIVGKCYAPLSTAADRACIAWALDEQAHYLARATKRREAGQLKQCQSLSDKVQRDAKNALTAYEKMRKNFNWKKGLMFKTMKGELLNEDAVAARFKEHAEAAQKVCKTK